MSESEIQRTLERLEKLATDASGWLSLYRDPATGRLWELSFPSSEAHGGGPRQLAPITEPEAKARYPDFDRPGR